MTNSDNNTIPDPSSEDTAGEEKIKRQKRWKIFGWSVIGLLGGLILANMFFWVEPAVNQTAFIVLFIAYVIYFILRRR